MEPCHSHFNHEETLIRFHDGVGLHFHDSGMKNYILYILYYILYIFHVFLLDFSETKFYFSNLVKMNDFGAKNKKNCKNLNFHGKTFFSKLPILIFHAKNPGPWNSRNQRNSSKF